MSHVCMVVHLRPAPVGLRHQIELGHGLIGREGGPERVVDLGVHALGEAEAEEDV